MKFNGRRMSIGIESNVILKKSESHKGKSSNFIGETEKPKSKANLAFLEDSFLVLPLFQLHTSVNDEEMLVK